MAYATTTTASNSRLLVWEEKIWRQSIKKPYFSRFHGDANSVVDVKMDFKGDRKRFTYLPKLVGSGVTNETTLEGKEENISDYTLDIAVTEYKHAVAFWDSVGLERSSWDFNTEYRTLIENWVTERLDQIQFTAIQASPTETLVPNTAFRYSSRATAVTALTAADTLSPDYLNRIAVAARTGFNRNIDPLRPVMVDGKEYFIVLVHPDCTYDLKTNASYRQAMLYARERSAENPIFMNAEAVWDSLVIHTHENITTAETGGAGGDVSYSQGVIMGAQSLFMLWKRKPKIVMEMRDYESLKGMAAKFMLGCAKPVFNSKDYGSMGLLVARTNTSNKTAS